VCLSVKCCKFLQNIDHFQTEQYKIKMTMPRYFIWMLSLAFGSFGCQPDQSTEQVDVLILGSGTGAVASAIQAGRMGAQVALVHPLPWYGGMLTSAGVSATDGNHHLPAGLWGEFRNALYDHYGGPDSVATGWVSLTQFEPSVGADILAGMVANTEGLQPYPEATWTDIRKVADGWEVDIRTSSGVKSIKARILIDGTDLGDVAAAVGAGFDVGMEASGETDEQWAPATANDIIQDMTYVAILEDYSPEQAPAIPKPENYDPAEFSCACRHDCPDTTVVSCAQMLDYGKLPGNKYMINWPNAGNDYYLNPIDLDPAERTAAYEAAKQQTLRFIYYIQQDLGFTHFGIARDAFPTEDGLALYPYHREGRRIQGLVRYTLNDIHHPYKTDLPLYRTGIAVGDYPVDHHHDKYPQAPELVFPPVPSFAIPAGTLIPSAVPNLLVADKPISVSNLANGSTRLQPVILQVGQVAGIIAAMAASRQVSPGDLPVRDIQQAVLDAGGYLMPYFDVPADDPAFRAVQRVGATGLLRGQGEPYLWANRTWFYPDSILLDTAIYHGIARTGGQTSSEARALPVTRDLVAGHLQQVQASLGLSAKANVSPASISGILGEDWLSQSDTPVTRREWAILLDELLDPFGQMEVGFEGDLRAARD